MAFRGFCIWTLHIYIISHLFVKWFSQYISFQSSFTEKACIYITFYSDLLLSEVTVSMQTYINKYMGIYKQQTFCVRSTSCCTWGCTSSVGMWLSELVLLLACVGGVRTDLYSSCTRTDSSSSASVWVRAERGNLRLLSLSACFYLHWGNASLPDLTSLGFMLCVEEIYSWTLRSEEINGGQRSAVQHIIRKQEEDPTPFPDRPCIPAWVDVDALMGLHG